MSKKLHELDRKTRRFYILKWKLFLRDGWKVRNRETYPEGHYWERRVVRYALCAFNCGTILYFENSTIDHYPIPKRDNGRLTLDNTRLACRPCNSRDGSLWSRDNGPLTDRYTAYLQSFMYHYLKGLQSDTHPRSS